MIHSLAEGKEHVPFRECKLTRLLADSFGSGTRTSLVITVNPTRGQLSESESSLQFGLRAVAIKVQASLSKKVAAASLDYKIIASRQEEVIALC